MSEERLRFLRSQQPGARSYCGRAEVPSAAPVLLRWHPYAVDPKQDYSKEPTTLVVFELEEIPKGTRLKLTESGFDRIPLARRAEAFRMNAQGWAEQVQNIARHVGQAT